MCSSKPSKRVLGGWMVGNTKKKSLLAWLLPHLLLTTCKLTRRFSSLVRSLSSSILFPSYHTCTPPSPSSHHTIYSALCNCPCSPTLLSIMTIKYPFPFCSPAPPPPPSLNLVYCSFFSLNTTKWAQLHQTGSKIGWNHSSIHKGKKQNKKTMKEAGIQRADIFFF